mgnify:CR=1 FL=1
MLFRSNLSSKEQTTRLGLRFNERVVLVDGMVPSESPWTISVMAASPQFWAATARSESGICHASVMQRTGDERWPGKRTATLRPDLPCAANMVTPSLDTLQRE